VSETYAHGYHPRENERLQDQAGTLIDLLHSDTSYPPGSVVLEAGCGVGAQTVTLARRSPGRVQAGITDPEAFDAGIRDFYRTAEADGVFCYTFFKGVGEKRRRA